MKPDGVIIETGPEHNHDSFMLENKVKKIRKEVLQNASRIPAIKTREHLLEASNRILQDGL